MNTDTVEQMNTYTSQQMVDETPELKRLADLIDAAREKYDKAQEGIIGVGTITQEILADVAHCLLAQYQREFANIWNDEISRRVRNRLPYPTITSG